MLRKLLAVVLLFSGSALAQTIAIRAGNLIDPATGTVSKNQIILVKNGKIAEVGPRVAIPAGMEVVDLSNSWVFPGLIDAHTHLTAGPAPGIPSPVIVPYLSESTGLRALRGAVNARAVLEAGFTAVRDVGNDAEYAAVDVRRSIERGWIPGPTMLTTGKIIAAFGGQSRDVPPEQGPFWKHEYLDADGPEEVRKAVRRNIYYGAKAIKLVADNSPYFYSQAEIRAAVEESHAAGLTIAVHSYGGQSARNVIMAGADSIEHGFDLTDDLLRLMKEKGVVRGHRFPGSPFEHDELQSHREPEDPGAAHRGPPAARTSNGSEDGLRHRRLHGTAGQEPRRPDAGLSGCLDRRGSPQRGNTQGDGYQRGRAFPLAGQTRLDCCRPGG